MDAVVPKVIQVGDREDRVKLERERCSEGGVTYRARMKTLVRLAANDLDMYGEICMAGLPS